MTASYGVFAADGNESTIAHLTCEKLRRHPFAFPAVEEQKRIGNCLDQELQRYQTAATSTQHEIELLREYRSRLIADLVTGRLDVREATLHHLPAETEEPEAVPEGEAEEDTELSSEEADG